MLFPFLLIAFGIAWGIIGLYIFLPERMNEMFGSLSGTHPLFYLAVYSPAISALFLILRATGFTGIKKFLSRALIWRTTRNWYLFLLLGIPLIFVAGAALKGTLDEGAFIFESIPALLIALALATIKGPIEEFGWRGFALPLLQRKLVPIWSALVLGVIWGIWHLPAFLLSGTQQSQWSFAAFFFGCLAISVIATALFNQTGGSILLSAFFHFTLMNPIFPDAQPYDTYLLIASAGLLIWRKKKEMFTSIESITHVVPPENGG